jgi:hypothetical protein
VADDFQRVEWWADLSPGPDEPLFLSLIKYRMDEDREPRLGPMDPRPRNLTSSYLHGSKLHAPILDLDGEHIYVESTTEGHAHLYLPPMPRWRMFLMLWGLRVAGVIEQGNFWWSLRRGGTFVRLPGVPKPESENLRYSYGMFFKIREK